MWKYQEGFTTHVGLGHAGIITAVTFSPNGEYIVTVSADGGIYRWRNPYFVTEKSDSQRKEAVDTVSVHSEPNEANLANSKELEECVTKTIKVKCKCKKPSCKCPNLKVTTTKVCKCAKPRCKCTLTIARPVANKTQSQSDVRKVIKVNSKEIGRNNIYGDYCPMPEKKQ